MAKSWLNRLLSGIVNNSVSRNRWTPSVIYPDDLFLVSYPKSGNTWVRFILSNLLNDNPDKIVDFHTAVEFVPEVGVHLEQLNALQSPRIIKSHAPYVSEYPHVVYLVRDVRDVYVSYYHYLRKSSSPDQSFSEFLRDETIWPCLWNDHVCSWVDRENVLVVRYEDLLQDTVEVVTQILIFWDKRSFSPEEIEQAVAASSFDEMKKLERERGRPFKSRKAAQSASTFMRSGKRGDWRNWFDEDDKRFLWQRAGSVMQRLGYEYE